MNTSEKIAHLYSRMGFGMAPNEWLSKQKESLKQAVNHLFSESKTIKKINVSGLDIPNEDEAQAMSEKKRQELREESRKLMGTLNANWVEEMAKGKPLLEKMSLFWHGHFACEPKMHHHAVNYLHAIRTHALGNFRELVLAIAKDASMILYLNNQQNKKNSPNENFAREVMELFTLGRGNYTEQDIKEAARAFTGWTTNRKTGDFEFHEKQHDFGSKTFMGKTGNWDGTDIINIILQKPEAAYFIAKKMYVFFVNDTPNAQHIQQLADAFYKSDYNIATLVRTMLESDWFYEDKLLGIKIKSPVELLVGFMKNLQLHFDDPKGILFVQKVLGQQLFSPPNVAGWAGGKTWIDNATLLVRLNLAGMIFQNAEVEVNLKQELEEKERKLGGRKLEVTANLQTMIQLFKATKAENLGKEMSQYLLRCPVEVSNSLLEQYAQQAVNQEDKIKAWVLGICSLPEYQMA